MQPKMISVGEENLFSIQLATRKSNVAEYVEKVRGNDPEESGGAEVTQLKKRLHSA